MFDERIHHEALTAIRSTLQQAQTVPMDPRMRVEAIAIAEHLVAALEAYGETHSRQ